MLVKAYLPYKVNFVLEVLETERPRCILFRSNHNWAMRRGERQLNEYVRCG